MTGITPKMHHMYNIYLKASYKHKINKKHYSKQPNVNVRNHSDEDIQNSNFEKYFSKYQPF